VLHSLCGQIVGEADAGFVQLLRFLPKERALAGAEVACISSWAFAGLVDLATVLTSLAEGEAKQWYRQKPSLFK